VQVALIRPGPIVANFVHPYTRRRRGHEEVKYPDGLREKLEPVLGRTQGIPIFQEQAMALSMALAGYTATEADELRRTMGNDRKRPKLLAALEKLRLAMIAKGIPESAAERLAADLQSFANYGFPESHAWSFALIAYVTAWLKAHEPAAFYAGLLNAWPMGFYSPATLVHDAKRHEVEVRGPCLASGEAFCTVEETDDAESPALRLGWRFVRGIGERVLERLTAARRAGPFTSIDDVVRRARLTRVEAKVCVAGPKPEGKLPVAETDDGFTRRWLPVWEKLTEGEKSEIRQKARAKYPFLRLVGEEMIESFCLQELAKDRSGGG
jgi:error-prone DNA polymerase